MRTLLCTIALAASPVAALAQSQLERMEAASEVMGEAGIRMMIDEMVANGAERAPLEAAMPDMSWDDEMRAAGGCLLERYNELSDRESVDQMLTRIEALADTIDEAGFADLVEMDEMGSLPDGISDDQAVEIMQTCGMMELQLRRMAESGFSDAMMAASQAGQ